ncbi:MAG TPA: hypothetical protein DCG49_06300 [Ruminococcus sp.]|nr:hypothetical protein [Ruminococcus sp.]
MNSIYTDREREARYSKLLAVKKRTEFALSIAMWGTLLFGTIQILIVLLPGLLNGLFMGDMSLFITAIVSLFALAFSVFAIYKRKVLITAAALVISLICTATGIYGFGAFMTIPCLIVAVIAHIFWQKLEKEDGFPEFQILFAEYAERERLQKSIAEHRALETCTRTAAAPASGEMHDLLDAATDIPEIPTALKNYHERGKQAQAFETEQETPTAQMNELEEI